MEDNKKRIRDESEEFDSPEVKRLRENLLQNLDDVDDNVEICGSIEELESFMKSFEEEITASPPPSAAAAEVKSVSDESSPELGFLLEASDDELGLPPTTSFSDFGETEKWYGDDDVELDYSDLGFGSNSCSWIPDPLKSQ